MESCTMTIALPRSTLLIAGLYCFLAGMSVANAFVARDAGYSPLWAVASAALSLGLAIHLVRAAARAHPTGPVPRSHRPPAT
jgi:hypothetical protein